ncbi:GNAT family N-acetyltransferase [Weissella paramesenteroides]|uniref:GNAT family N-acetyltransferase n=1 Tax=Weissella paramesenteroides TaxID=1249 RepID=UPI00123AD9F5|nr:GNAT family N-acetyltransferase [Weissella paramesenteroides]KAA8442661.1 GNAT family N-acetyltransferase [Weissella paramesenteroides]KAA8443007.1 GNAT family N-acetyltransferase [Weissella paramesenteroides]KAA8444317.1 GNAT family N-acetyltransferase [Weissella paramesenteroides]KAA8447985.1 GNAT family N-acetyltransferase [Weissella paramesenteroides]KAA8452202.1 GNAT family N-acetyltransferase [Weissella paramesenteroides]
MHIKKLDLTDINELQKVSVETFYDTFADQNTEKNMQDYVSNSYKLETLTEELKNKNSFFYFVLSDEDDIMGYLKLNISDAQSEDDFENALEIERIYIRKEFQKQGLGKILYNIALTKATELEKQRIWLGVWEFNQNAKAFYQHLGFEFVGSHIFNMGADPQTDLIMVKSI